jgi:hypothetical protein
MIYKLNKAKYAKKFHSCHHSLTWVESAGTATDAGAVAVLEISEQQQRRQEL